MRFSKIIVSKKLIKKRMSSEKETSDDDESYSKNETSDHFPNSFTLEHGNTSASYEDVNIVTEIKTDKTNQKSHSKDSFENDSNSSSSSYSSTTHDISGGKNAATSRSCSRSSKYTESSESGKSDSTHSTGRPDLTNHERENYIIYLKKRLESKRQDQLKQYSYTTSQIKKCLTNVHANLNLVDNPQPKYPNVLLNGELINRIKTKNLLKRIDNEQTKKIENYGQSLLEDVKHSPLESAGLENFRKNSQKIYYRMKCEQIKSKKVEQHLDEHFINYCDSIMLIGNLASALPRFSDPPKKIWNQLLEPLLNSIK